MFSLASVTVGPLTLVQVYVTIVPSESVPEPFNTVVFAGRVTVLFPPALAMGATFNEATITFIVTCANPVAPLLSVAVSLKT